MHYSPSRSVTISTIVFSFLCISCAICSAQTVTGEQLDPSTYGPSVVEPMTAVLGRARSLSPFAPAIQTGRLGQNGSWIVAASVADSFPSSGIRNITNQWGDSRMGIAFPTRVDVQGAYVAGHGTPDLWTRALRIVGYRNGQLVTSTNWSTAIGAQPVWLTINFNDVDRIVIESRPQASGSSSYSLDDLTFTALPDDGQGPTVLDFEDAPLKQPLSGSGYAGLIWETGSGDFGASNGVPGPEIPPGAYANDPVGGTSSQTLGSGTLPQLRRTFQGVIRGDAGSFSFPPDTMGAVGPNHFVITVNRVFAVYDRVSGTELINIHLQSFLPGSNGDPRVLFDQHSSRWFVIVSDFNTRIYLAVSVTDDPTGSWFKTSFVASQGSDSGRFPDYPTLGVDARGIYTAAYMVPSRMTIFAIAKPPLIAASPSLGTVTAFRGFPFEGAIQPAHTYGDSGGELLISRRNAVQLRIRRVNPPLTAPTLTTVGDVAIPAHGLAGGAPALGSVIPLSTVDHRLMMSMFRDGSLWTCHTINLNGRAACRWYEIDPIIATIKQSGTVADSTLHFSFPSIMVNRNGHVAMGFSGSHANQYAGAYFTGRQASDPPGEMAPPVQYQVGNASQNNVDSVGRNRWGDYSYTTLDPTDERTIWTIQEYAHDVDIWGMRVAVLDFDCNENGVDDAQDVTDGTSLDCNGNSVPDECEPNDDCNSNGTQDICDIAAGSSQDCNLNHVPDSCEPNADCNTNGTQDICDIADGTSTDCNGNGVPDLCDVTSGSSPDCDSNLVPDECDPVEDCNGNGIQDSCEVATGAAPDCNSNGVPDSCDFFDCGLGSGVCAGSGDCCTPSGNGTPGCDCASCCQSVCAADSFCCNVEWDFLCANQAAQNPNCNCGSNPLPSQDCNNNEIPDECDLSANTSLDCNANGIPDECDPNTDCNNNTIQDICDIAAETSEDCNDNDLPDECEPNEDCNSNGVQDICDIATGFSLDCNGNEVPDLCDIASLFSDDCNANQIPDECEPNLDCNENGVQDICDIGVGTSPDCNANNVPDECDIFSCGSPVGTCPGTGDCCDLNGNDSPGCDCAGCCASVCAVFPSCCTSTWDSLCAFLAFFSPDCDCFELRSRDCNGNDTPDECDIADMTSPDCNNSGVPDECEPDLDCNGNGTQDICDTASGASLDCNANEIPDECEPDCNGSTVPDDCDVLDGTSLDCNNNLVPDECDPNLDCNSNGIQDICDTSGGASPDCNNNEIPDECEPDCNQNGSPDDCDVGGVEVPAADACADAKSVCPGLTYNGTTTGATNDGSATCAASSTTADVWYRYRPAESGLLTVSLCGSNFDTALSLHSACTGSIGNQIACNDDSCGLQSEVSATVTAGNDYLIRVSGFSFSTGDFTMTLSGPPCVPVSFDCNGNLIPDECDVQDGSADDCNGNLVPDECDTTIGSFVSPQLGPVESGTTQTFSIVETPNALGDVSLHVEAVADLLLGTRFIRVELNGILITNLFQGNGSLCPAIPNQGSFVIPRDTFNNLVSGTGLATFELIPIGSISAAACSGSYIEITVTFPVEWDCNNSGTLDGCDIAGGSSGDCNQNSLPDECDIARGASVDCTANGIPDECEPDCNENGTPDSCDVLASLSLDCNANFVPDECEADFDFDGVIDGCDPCPRDALDDRDGDGACDSDEACPRDPNKLDPGVCGCGVADVDSDGDTVMDCIDDCPGVDDLTFGPECQGEIPAMSNWGFVIALLALMIAAKVSFRRQRLA